GVKARQTNGAGVSIDCFGVETRCPDDDRHTAVETPAHVRLDGVGPCEVDRCVAPGEAADPPVHDLVAGGVQRRSEHRPDLADEAEDRDLHAACASASGFTRAIASRNRSSLGPIPPAERPSGANNSAARATTSSAVTDSTRWIVSSTETISTPVASAFPLRR